MFSRGNSAARRLGAAVAGCVAVVCGLFAQIVPAHAMYSITPEAAGFTVNSKAYYLYNVDTDFAVAESHSQDPFIPASTVKIMTAILALENCDDLDEGFTYPQYIYDTLNGTGASHADVKPGEEMTMRKALYCLMLQSDCFSAMGIADRIGGDQESFVAMMNDKAKDIGAVNTRFTNAHGLMLTDEDEQMQTTAYDLFLMAKYAMKVDGFMDIASTGTIDISPTSKHPDNYRLISTVYPQVKAQGDYYYEPMRGIKTGSLPDVGFNFVCSATRDGYTYILVLLGGDYYDPSSGYGTAQGKILYEETGERRPVFRDAVNIFEWAFGTFEVRQLYKKGEQLAEMPVKLAEGDTDHVKLVAADDFSALVNTDAVLQEPQTNTSSGDSGVTGIIPHDVLPQDPLEAPIEAGTYVGYREIIYGGVLGSVNLLTQEAVKRSQTKYILSKVESLFDEFWIKFTIVLVVLVVAVYVALMVLRNRYNKRYRRARGRRK